MRKKVFILFSLIAVFSAFLAVPYPVFGGEGEKEVIWGEMEFSPPNGNALGEIILLKVRVFYDKERVKFDARQIPEKIIVSPLEIRSVKHSVEKSGEYIVEVWEFKTQCLAGKPPIEYKIRDLKLQYQKKDASYLSSFEVAGSSVSFISLISNDTPLDPIIKKLELYNPNNLVLLLRISALLLFFGGLGLVIFFLKNKQKKKGASSNFQPTDEFLEKYLVLRQSLKQGENNLKVLDGLYRLLRSYYKERRGLKLKIGWEDCLPEEEKVFIKELQSLYGLDSISKSHAFELLDRAKNILGGGQ